MVVEGQHSIKIAGAVYPLRKRPRESLGLYRRASAQQQQLAMIEMIEAH